MVRCLSVQQNASSSVRLCSQTLENVTDARRSDEGVLKVRLGAVNTADGALPLCPTERFFISTPVFSDAGERDRCKAQ